MGEKSLFWADQIANTVLGRKKFRYLNKPIPRLNKFTVKTSASLSGVLHIGRLSDTIRGESVFLALKDLGVKSEFIWVAEDMDPLRKVPKGIPESYTKYIGMPVTDIPDPDGCHNSYAEHHASEYMRVIGQFVRSKMTKYSMRKEYKKGSFRPYIKKILDNLEEVIEIQNKYRSEPLETGWCPWMPVCERCGKIITPRVIKFEDGLVHYRCQDYSFAKTIAKGCGHEGINDPLRDEGKLMWKSEWAAQWALWGVVSEGAGKEYQVPMSAWWVNSEIVERIFGFPAPEPIFYEHILIDGQKMSASLGNVVYPKDWLEVASPEVLRFFYNKKLMKTRSFSWKELPKLYDDFDRHAKVYFGKIKIANERERKHMKRLFEISLLDKPRETVLVPYDFAAVIAQVSSGDTNKALDMLRRTGHIPHKLSERDLEAISRRLVHSGKWVEKYNPELKFEIKKTVSPDIKKILSERQKKAVRELGERLNEPLKEQELYDLFWELSEKWGIKAGELFKACYLIILGQDRGPRLAPFILAVGRNQVAKLLKSV